MKRERKMIQCKNSRLLPQYKFSKETLLLSPEPAAIQRLKFDF